MESDFRSDSSQQRTARLAGRPMPLGVNERRGSTFGSNPGNASSAGTQPWRSSQPHRTQPAPGSQPWRNDQPRPARGRQPQRNGQPQRSGRTQAQRSERPPIQGTPRQGTSRQNPSYRSSSYDARRVPQRREPQHPQRRGSQRYGSQRPQYLRSSSQPLFGGSNRNGRSGRMGRGYQRGRNGWQSILSNPRVLVSLLAVLVLGFGVFTIVSAVQRNAAEAAAREEAAAEKKKLAAQTVHPSKLGQTATTFSTPQSAWQQGTMPHLYQTDPAWSEKPYGGGTVRVNACGPTCMTMVYVYLTGKTDYDPGTMSAFADEHNYAPTGATEWAFMTEGAALLGLTGTNINPTRANIVAALQAGQPVIVSVNPGDFTLLGHYIVLKGIDENGMVEVFDPNSPMRSARKWGIQRLLLQINNAWTYTV